MLVRKAAAAAVFAWIVVCLPSLGEFALAGTPDEDYVINVSSASGFTGDQEEITITFDLLADGIDGWGFGICHNEALVDIDSASDIEDGADILTIDDGDPPFFQAILILNGGWTVGVLVSSIGFQLPPGSDLEIYHCTYDLLAPGTATLNVCGTLGNPVVAVEMIVGASATVVPETNSGTLTIVDVPPIFALLEAVDTDLIINPAGLTLQQADVDILLTHSDASLDVGAFSFGVTHDANKLELLDIDIDGTVTEDVNGGFGPDFLVTNTDPAGGTGGTIAVVVSLAPPFDTIDQGSDQVIAHFVYQGAPGANPGDTVQIQFTDALGSPPVDLVISVEGATFTPILVSGTVTVSEQDVVVHAFERGDTNNDGNLALADALFLLAFLFTDGDAPDCEETANFNANSTLELADALFFLAWLFLDGAPPPPPFPACEIATSDLCAEDTVGCD